MGKLVKKAFGRLRSGAGRTGASYGKFKGSTQYTGRAAGSPEGAGNNSPVNPNAPRRGPSRGLGGAKTPLSR